MCGLVGVRFFKDQGLAKELAVSLLLRLQHRGQDGAGVTVLDQNGEFQSLRGMGLVQSALALWADLADGEVAISHTRYATTGRGSVAELQPFVKGSPRVALAHNGNIVNTAELVEKYDLTLSNESDLDVLQQVFLQASAEEGFEKAVQTIFDNFNGGYAVVGIEDSGSLFAFRDPYGIRPLFVARGDGFAVVASETGALSALNKVEITEVPHGGWLHITDEGIQEGTLQSRSNPKREEKFCMFESVYFSSPQSEVKKKSVYRLRFQLGEVLAEEIRKGLGRLQRPSEIFDYVVPVPETSRAAATGVAERLQIPFREFLVKNPYIPRTFILGKQSQRIKALNAKLSLIGPEIKGKDILLVDDSVVRGNTSRLMALRLKEAGASSVSLASTCPPITHGCFYGIDFPDREELVANGRDNEAISRELGVDKLFYISLEGLKEALESENLCTACLTGSYPTWDQSFEKFLEARRIQRGDEGKVDRLDKEHLHGS